jgi:asparagine synthase (glutamine-hydrolysing)
MSRLPGLVITIGKPFDKNRSHDYNTITKLVCDSFNIDPNVGCPGGGQLWRFDHNKAAGVATNLSSNAGLAIDASPDLLYKGNRITPVLLLTEYLIHGPKIVQQLDGQFMILAWRRPNEVMVASDRYGLRPYYRNDKPDALHIGTSAKELSSIGGDQLQIEETYLYGMLSYSRVTPGDLTWFKNYKAISPATQIIWNGPRIIKESNYWDYFVTSKMSCANSVSDLADALRAAVNNSCDSESNLGVCLSGGLDSRLILAAMSPRHRKEVSAFTWGQKVDSDEISIAGLVAKTAGVKWSWVKVSPCDFVRDADSSIDVLEGRDHAVQGYARGAFESVSLQCKTVTTGLAFDILLSGSYSSFIQEGNIRSSEFTGLRSHILERYRYFKYEPLEMFQRPDIARAQIDHINLLLQEDMSVVSDDHGANIDRFILRQRGWRQLFPRQQWQRMYVEDVTPTFSNDLMDIMLSLDSSERQGCRLTRELLKVLDPTLMNIPYQRTLLPVAAPIQYWDEAARLEAQKEDLYRRIFYESKGEVYIPYNRYYTNFDEWQRVEACWIDTIDYYLSSEDSVLKGRYLNPAWLKSIIYEQRLGSKRNFQIINVLLTVEIMLRRFS